MNSSVLPAPYHNLILTGYIGISKNSIGRQIAARLEAPFVDLESEIQLREGMPPDEIRQLFGEARLRALEEAVCQELGLRRGSVVSVTSSTLLPEANRQRLMNSGPVLIMTCALNEVLRRLHASQGARFHDPKVRSTALTQIRRERQILQIPGLATLDTTRLNAEQITERAIAFWFEQETITF